MLLVPIKIVCDPHKARPPLVWLRVNPTPIMQLNAYPILPHEANELIVYLFKSLNELIISQCRARAL